MTIKYIFNPFSGTFDAVDSLTNPLQFMGDIDASTDFPLIASVQNGWFYTVSASVTDNAGATYTNTGQSFVANDEIAWNGTNWSLLGNNSQDLHLDQTTPQTVTGGSPLFNGGITLNATSIVTDTTTGLKVGTATNQKIGFFNTTPVVQQTATTDLGVVLSNLGLRASGTAYPITTSGTVTLSGILKHSGSTLSFYNATGISQPNATTDLGTVLSSLGLRAAGTAYPITTSGAVNLRGIAIIDKTDTEALLVRKASDGGDIFTVDTTNGKVIVGGDLKQIGITGEEDIITLASGTVTIKANDTITLSGTGFVDSPSYKAGGTAPVADGTYTVGIGGTTNGTITIKGGIITAVQEAVA